MNRSRNGQSLVEAALALLVFMSLLLGVLDVGQVLFAHQSLVERVREATRWGSLHTEGGSERVVNFVLYGQPDAPSMSTAGFLGLTEDNVRAEYRSPTELRPDDDVLHVEIVNYESHLFSPWFATALISPRPVSMTAPVAARYSE
jgi:hypothetical protein